jgi:hypothetical protein
MAARFCATTWASRRCGTRQLPTNSLLLCSAHLAPRNFPGLPFASRIQTIQHRQIQTSQSLIPSESQAGANNTCPPSKPKKDIKWMDYAICGLAGASLATFYFQRKERRRYKTFNTLSDCAEELASELDARTRAYYDHFQHSTNAANAIYHPRFLAWFHRAMIAAPPSTEEEKALAAFLDGRFRLLNELPDPVMEYGKLKREFVEKVARRKALREKGNGLVPAGSKQAEGDLVEPTSVEQSEAPSEKKEE